MVYTLTLNPAIDYVIGLEGSLLPGQINRAAWEEYQFGGKGINVSNMLRNLGQDTVALGFVAGFTGAALEQGLTEMGLQTRFIHTAAGLTRVNVKVKAAQETEINGIGPVISQEDMHKLHARLDSIQPGDVLVLSGSVPKCLPGDIYGQILARLQGRNICAVVDTAGQPLLDTLQYRPFLVKPNHHELNALFAEGESEEAILSCARRLQAMGAANVLVSMAEAGALLLDETGVCHRIGCPRGQVVNSVGAGDAMVAGFLAGWLETGDYSRALKRGTAAGSATAFSLGLAPKALVEQLLQTME